MVRAAQAPKSKIQKAAGHSRAQALPLQPRNHVQNLHHCALSAPFVETLTGAKQR